MSLDAVPGARFGPYEIGAGLGAGGMGEVYVARDTRLDREVAIKVLPAHLLDSVDARERLSREARAVAKLQHPHICAIYDVGETDTGRAFIVMERLHGETLQQRISRGSLDAAAVAEIGAQLADALDAAHRAGVIHRDVKPANIFLTAHGPKLLDFGLARIATHSTAATLAAPLLTEPGGLVGTIAYMSPEQLRGDASDHRTDIYSLGLVLLEMATGSRDPDSAPNLPAGLRPVVAKCMQRDRALRYQQMSEVRDALRQLASGKKAARAWHSRRWAFAAAGAAALVAAAIVLFQSRRASALTDKDTIVLADFSNTTGDAVFDDTLRQGLSVQLQQSPFLRLLPDQRIQQTLRLMDQSPDTRLSGAVAREVCERTGSAAVLEGSIATLGSQYVLGLRAQDCRTGEQLDQQQVQAARKENVLDALTEIAGTFRRRVGESLATVQAHSTPLMEATTRSLEALKAFSEASRLSRSQGPEAAIAGYQRAIALDPTFAMAYAEVGIPYTARGQWPLAAEMATKAYELRNRTTDRERFFIEFTYQRQVTGNLERACDITGLWAQTYPRDVDAPGLRGGLCSHGTGKYEQVIEAAERGLTIDPDHGYLYVNMASAMMLSDRPADAERILARAAERKIAMSELPVLQYQLGFLAHDRPRMDRQLQLMRGRRSTEGTLTALEMLADAQAGELEKAAALARSATDIAVRESVPDRVQLIQTAASLWDALFGNTAAARRRASEVLRTTAARDLVYGNAVALALSGETASVEPLADGLERRFPEDTFVKYTYVPTIAATVSLNRGNAARALELLEGNKPYELAINGLSFTNYFGNLYPVYVRGLSYLALHKGAEAAGEFEKILQHRGLVLEDPLGAAARVQRARALAMAGDTAKARAAYDDFLELWKHADEGIPLFVAARAERAQLEGK